MSGAFAKQDSQSWWTRRKADPAWQTERQEKRRRLAEPEDALDDSADSKAKGSLSMLLNEGAPAEPKASTSMPLIQEVVQPTTEEGAAKVIVIHPGSRWLRIGRASDPLPATIQHVIARKRKTPRNARLPTSYEGPPLEIDETLDPKIEAIRTGFRSRMRDYKLRQAPNGSGQASAYNETSHPDIIPELNDPFKIDWTEPAELGNPDALIGQEVGIPSYMISTMLIRI